MILLIDDADIQRIKEIYHYYLVDGVTTNPSILAKYGENPYKALTAIREFIGIRAQLHVQVVSKTAEAMVEEGRKIERILGNNTYVDDGEDIFYSWQNSYDKETKICTFDLTFFEKDEDVYYRYDETHYERAYSVEEITMLLEKAGMEVAGIYDNLSFDAPTDKSERIFFVAIEKGK